MGGMELEEESKVWKEVASCEARLSLMKKMIKHNLAFADLEEFGHEFTNKLKSSKLKNTTLYRKLSQPAMKAKMIDEQMLRKEMMRVKMKMKRELSAKLTNDRTRKYKKVVKHLNNLAKTHKQISQEKNIRESLNI